MCLLHKACIFQLTSIFLRQEHAKLWKGWRMKVYVKSTLAGDEGHWIQSALDVAGTKDEVLDIGQGKLEFLYDNYKKMSASDPLK